MSRPPLAKPHSPSPRRSAAAPPPPRQPRPAPTTATSAARTSCSGRRAGALAPAVVAEAERHRAAAGRLGDGFGGQDVVEERVVRTPRRSVPLGDLVPARRGQRAAEVLDPEAGHHGG